MLPFEWETSEGDRQNKLNQEIRLERVKASLAMIELLVEEMELKGRLLSELELKELGSPPQGLIELATQIYLGLLSLDEITDDELLHTPPEDNDF